MRKPSLNALGLPFLALVLTGCAAATSRPLADGSESSAGGMAAETPGTTPAQRAVEPRGADLRFVLGMIAHHEQALAMTRLVPARSHRNDLRLLAERMDVSQRDEIALLNTWLSQRGASAPAASAHSGHGGEHPAIHGMLTPAQLGRLADAKGAEFDRLFLEYMISHHEGALVMIRELFSTPGAGQDPEVFRFASEIEADQRTEITRMRQLLAMPPQSGRTNPPLHHAVTSHDSH